MYIIFFLPCIHDVRRLILCLYKKCIVICGITSEMRLERIWKKFFFSVKDKFRHCWFLLNYNQLKSITLYKSIDSLRDVECTKKTNFLCSFKLFFTHLCWKMVCNVMNFTNFMDENWMNMKCIDISTCSTIHVPAVNYAQVEESRDSNNIYWRNNFEMVYAKG